LIDKLTHYPVNWIDGMKIRKDHFVELENFAYELNKDTIGLFVSALNYGLLPASADMPSLDLIMETSQNASFQLKVHSCRAVTANGTRIEIVRSAEHVLNGVLSDLMTADQKFSQEGTFYVVVAVDLYERSPAGIPSPVENPPRHPSAVPVYRVSVLPSEQVNIRAYLGSQLIVGKLLLSNGVLKTDSTFIPSCVSIVSHQSLTALYRGALKIMIAVKTDLVVIIQKIKVKSQKNSLTESVNFLSEKLIFSLAPRLPYATELLPHQAPVFLYELLVSLLQTIRTVLDCLVDKEREELLAYFSEWSDRTAGTFEIKLGDALKVSYDHNAIYDSIEPMTSYLEIFSELLTRLGQLEYIGKRKGQSVFIAETADYNTVIDKPKEVKRFSPLS